MLSHVRFISCGCFLDASKAFDLVINHGMLFQKLLDRGLPMPVVRFLSL